MDGHIWLIGMMGSGKSAVARAAASRWDVQLVDTDDEVIRRLGCSIAQFWGERGEAAFRDMEAAALQRVAEGPPAVIATGGGVVLRPANVAAMRATGRIVWLAAPAEVLSARVGDGAGRPLLDEESSPERLAALLESRREAYAAAADLVVDVTTASVDEVVDRIEAAWTRS